ncbi:rhamnosyltransferase [Nocardioides terrae]|uniref:Rhamnosyltransferase n=1 Tax=Nocardioides terrae TaxID=574651 RepID=A0A1I1IQV6_9ACTN|nr:rhamnan synthesis F family protein [Nocardioides terrae]SFC38615.1 rhamnosyltransferase [Nocardioides terrae]
MRRVVFYLFFDPAGVVDDFVLHKLASLRDHAEHIFLVSNGPLSGPSRERLEGLVDTIWVRENVGFDVWAYKESLDRFGRQRLAEYDELVLMNYTFFGPVGSFAPLFDDMEARDVDFWGITDHAATVHPAAPDKPLPEHIQSHWIAVRRRMFSHETWHRYWRDLPMTSSYVSSITGHEGRFTQFFKDAGFEAAVAYPAERYPTSHPVIENTVELLADGCPIVKRRSFFSDPLYLDKRGIDTTEIADEMERRGYPVEIALRNLARTSEPRVLMTNLGLLEILSDRAPAAAAPSRVVAIGHVAAGTDPRRLLGRLEQLPTGTQVVLTVPDDATGEIVSAAVEDRTYDAEIRVLGTRRGEDVAALLVGCRDVIARDDVDLLVRLRTVRAASEGRALQAAFWERQLHDNLLRSSGYFANVAALFDEHPSLGMVFPPAVHISRATLGFGWRGTRLAAKALAADLGIDVPFDKRTPVAPYGGMFVARPQALRPLLAADWGFEDFADPEDDSLRAFERLENVVERLLAYASLGQGLHVREVAHPATAALSYKYLEYKYQLVAAEVGSRPDVQLRTIRGLKASAKKG